MKIRVFYKVVLVIGCFLLGSITYAADNILAADDTTPKRIVVGAGRTSKNFHTFPTPLTSHDITIDWHPSVHPHICENWKQKKVYIHPLIRSNEPFDEVYVAHVGFGLLSNTTTEAEQFLMQALAFCVNAGYKDLLSADDRKALIEKTQKYTALQESTTDDLQQSIINTHFGYLDSIKSVLKEKGLIRLQSENPLPPTPITTFRSPNHEAAGFDIAQAYTFSDYLKYTLFWQHGLIPDHKVECTPLPDEAQNFFHKSVVQDLGFLNRSMEVIKAIYQKIFHQKGFEIKSLEIIEEPDRKVPDTDLSTYTFEIIAQVI